MSISKWLDQSPKHTKNYDVVIVGAGIAGLSTAYWLQKNEPQLKIALIEKNKMGSGASGRNAGFVTCGSIEHFMKLQKELGLEKALEIWRFSEKNHSLLKQEIIQDDPDSFDYKLTGSCTIAPNEERWQDYQNIASLLRNRDIDVSDVSPRDIQEDYGLNGFIGGVRYEGDGYIHPLKLLTAIRNKLNIDFFENTEVFKFETTDNTEAIYTNQGTFKSNKVFLTVNAYLPLILKEFDKLIKPGRGQVLMTEPLPEFVRGPCYLTKYLCYFRQLPSGHLLVGGFRNLDVQTENTYEDKTTPLIQEALFNFIMKHFKFGSDAKIAYQWSGVMGFSPDGQMLLGAHPKNKNIQIMAGCSGHGMGLSFHAAKVLVESTLGSPLPPHLNINRFPI